MSQVKIQEILRCSSEDPVFPSRNLVKGLNKWICSKDNVHETIEVELLLQKAALISFIDIGNYGSQFVDILVSHTLREKNKYHTLLPTFTFMSVGESKQGINKRKVLMFKKDDLMADVRDMSWDKVKIVCRQPFGKNMQFGLSFISVRSVSTSPISSPTSNRIQESNQTALKSFFGLNSEDHAKNTTPKPVTEMKASVSPFQQRHKIQMKTTSTSPVLHKALSQQKKGNKTPTMNEEQQIEFIEEVTAFVNMFKEDILMHPDLIVSDLRKEFENDRGKSLTRMEKKIFTVVLSKRKKKLEERNDSSRTESCELLPDGQQKCTNCGILLPSDVIEIHSSICNTPQVKRKRDNRNSICLSYDDDDDDDVNVNGLKRSGNKPATRNLSMKTGKSSGPYRKKTVKSENKNLFEIDNSFPCENEESNKSEKFTNKILTTNETNKNNDVLNISSTPEDTPLNLEMNNFNNPTSREQKDLVSSNVGKMSYLEKEEQINSTYTAHHSNDNENTEQRNSNVEVIERSYLPNKVIEIEDSKTIECPMCFKQIEEDRISVHAAICDGKNIEDSNQLFPEMQQCHVCNEMISKYLIGIHTSQCEASQITSMVISFDKQEDIPERGFHSKMICCPICSKEFECSYIDIHVNICLDSS